MSNIFNMGFSSSGILCVLCYRYVVVGDPPGTKVGSGGSTLHCLDYLSSTFGQENLSRCEFIEQEVMSCCLWKNGSDHAVVVSC